MTKEEKQKIIDDTWRKAQQADDPMIKEINNLFNKHNEEMLAKGIKRAGFIWRIKNELLIKKVERDFKLPITRRKIFEVNLWETTKAYLCYFIGSILNLFIYGI